MERAPQSAAAQRKAESCASRAAAAAAAAVVSSAAQRPQSPACACQCAVAQGWPQYTALRQPEQCASEAAEQPGARQGEPMGAVGRGAGGEDMAASARARFQWRDEGARANQ